MFPLSCRDAVKISSQSAQLVVKATSLSKEKIPTSSPYNFYQALANIFYPVSLSNLVESVNRHITVLFLLLISAPPTLVPLILDQSRCCQRLLLGH